VARGFKKNRKVVSSDKLLAALCEGKKKKEKRPRTGATSTGRNSHSTDAALFCRGEKKGKREKKGERSISTTKSEPASYTKVPRPVLSSKVIRSAELTLRRQEEGKEASLKATGERGVKKGEPRSS